MNPISATLEDAVRGDQTAQTRVPASGWWWASFDWARAPYYYVVVLYVFSAYFAQTVVGSGAEGQTLFSTMVTLAGLIMAVIAPVLGHYMDRGGRKKPVLAIVMGTMALAAILMGLVPPDAPFAIGVLMALMVVGGCCYSISELFHNALLPAAGSGNQIPAISGLGLSTGALAAVLILGGVFWFATFPPAGLTATDVSRYSAMFCGFWLFLFIRPFFLFARDLPGAAGQWRGVPLFAKGVRPIRAAIELFRDYRQIMRFLIARMVFMDGLSAMFAVLAVYVSGAMGWSGPELALMGIISTISAVLGGFLGGALDRTFGPRRAIIAELMSITAIFIFQIGIFPDAILFGLVPVDGVADRAIFPRTTDLIYLAAFVPTAAFIIAAFSSSRSLLVELTPTEKIGQFFGIFAMTSTITVWVGPGLVALTTWLSDSQRVGFASITILLVVGSALMTRVKPEEAAGAR